jgi:hypothetical protein
MTGMFSASERHDLMKDGRVEFLVLKKEFQLEGLFTYLPRVATSHVRGRFRYFHRGNDDNQAAWACST